jgi:hypothetical protein
MAHGRLDGNARKLLARDQDPDLPRIPVPNRCVEDRAERAESGLNPGITKLESIEGAKAPRVFLGHGSDFPWAAGEWSSDAFERFAFGVNAKINFGNSSGHHQHCSGDITADEHRARSSPDEIAE